jgi:cysteine desulfurase
MLVMPQDNFIYLDFAATTPVDPRVLEVMQPYFIQDFGNPSSVHRFGQRAENALEEARESIAAQFNCLPAEIVFTSCGTESDNLALRGVALAARQERQANHILISPVEHHAISHTAQQLHQLFGFELEYLPIDKYGMVPPQAVEAALRPDTAIVSVIYANNEIGTINPIAEIGEICRSRNITFHTDAVQAAPYLHLDANILKVDLLSISAHKFYGPKGVGALYIRKGTPILPVQTGGGQEFKLRAGTQNIPYIVGMAKALELAQAERSESLSKLIPMRDHLIGSVLETIPQTQLTGHPVQRLPNHASFIFEGVDSNLLLTHLDLSGFACSSGSACKTGSPEPSEVLLALGIPPTWALGSLRLTLGRYSTPAQIDKLLSVLPGMIEQIRRTGSYA